MEIMNGARKLVTRNHLTRKKLLAQKQRFGGGEKKGEKSQRNFCLQTNVFFTLELMGVESGHGKHIKHSREGKTLTEEAKMK